MHCKLDDLGKKYIQKYYDRHMSLLNTGGMTLVSEDFFEWGKKVMAVSRQRLTKDILKKDPKRGFAAAKEQILQDESLRHMFRDACRRKFTNCDAAVNTVYNITATKIVHTLFAVQFKLFKEKAVTMKNKIALRNQLKVTEANRKGHAKNKTSKSSSQSSWKKAQCNKGKKRLAEGLPQPTSAESKLARRRRRETIDRRRLKKRLFVDS